MERCLDLQIAGAKPLVIRSENLQRQPLRAIERTLEFLGIELSAPEALQAELGRDSQAGTEI